MALRTMNHEPQTARSWHHRMARLYITNFDYRPACQAADCPVENGFKASATFICEWDQSRGARSVSGQKLYCAVHAGNFALKHNIYMAGLPDVPLSQLETASRDDWRYANGGLRTEDSGQKIENREQPSSVICHPSSGINSEEK